MEVKQLLEKAFQQLESRQDIDSITIPEKNLRMERIIGVELQNPRKREFIRYNGYAIIQLNLPILPISRRR